MTSRKIPESAVENLVSDLDAKANVGLDNSPYTTNRILEIPQDIKLKLNNGTLTLKAGSKVYVPNGFEADGTTSKFDVVITKTDITRTISDNGSYFISLTTDTAPVLSYGLVSICFSGNTEPSSIYSLWYNTSSNIIQNPSGNRRSFPIAIVTVSNSSITSIDQVFNGLGYIGSTVFALPGVKVQIPNGRNADGTYNYLLKATTSVIKKSVSGSGLNRYIMIDSNGNMAGPTEKVKYDSELNSYIYTHDNSKPSWCIFAELGFESGKITSWKPYTVDSVANSNASNFSQSGRSYLSGLGMPSNRYIDLTLGASGSNYTAPANGWFSLRKSSSSSSRQFLSFTGSNMNLTNECYLTGAAIGSIFPCEKGERVSISYTLGGDTLLFRFIYAEGEK